MYSHHSGIMCVPAFLSTSAGHRVSLVPLTGSCPAPFAPSPSALYPRRHTKRPRSRRVSLPSLSSELFSQPEGDGDLGSRGSSDDFSSSPTGGGTKRRWEEPTLDETFDAIDDVMMDRLPGEGREKVKVFGAWLDADIAGRKAGQGNRAAGLIARAERGEVLADKEKAEVFYEEAISVMRTGRDYDTSFALLEKAVFLTGEDSRRGGEFKLWAVSALQGVGRNKQAVELLRTLKTHRDLDVRKVSAEMLYIAQAPQLKLNEDDFVKFPDVSHLTETFDKTKWKEVGKPKVVPWKKKDDDQGYYIGADTGQAPGNDPVMLVSVICIICALSYAFLG